MTAAFSLGVQDGIATLTFDQPGEKVNLLDRAAMEELDRIVGEIGRRTDLSCLVLRSGKAGVFVAGADLKELAAITSCEEASSKSAAGQKTFDRIADLPFPTVAVIDGAAAGGGLELALACDFRVVTDSPRTQLSLPETSLGLIPGWGGTYRLPRLTGLRQAVRMIVGGRSVDGPRAAAMGLADVCCATAFVEKETRDLVATVLEPEGRRTVLRRRRRSLAERLIEGSPPGRAIVFAGARREVTRRAGGHYPAPLAALTVLRRGAAATRERALELERQALGELVPGPVCRNLVALFFAREAARRAAGPPKGVARAAVLGAGIMGAKIAWLFTRRGASVVVKDVSWPLAQRAYASAHESYRELARRGRIDRREIELAMHRLSAATDYSALGRPEIVVEAVVEKEEVKKKALAEVEARVDDATVIASNTSSLSINGLAGALRSPGRFVGMHFFNPPTIMPLVEVIPASTTTAETVRAAAAIAAALGKTPIVVGDRPGFLVNRLLMPYLNESVRLLDEGCDLASVDRALTAFGMPMGPFRLLDEIGLDVAAEVASLLAKAFGRRMRAGAFFDAIQGRGDLLGKKTGKGFYVHRGGARRVNPEILALVRRRGAPRRACPAAEIVERPILAMVNEAARALEEEVVTGAAELDLAMVLGTGFPAFRGGILRYADSLGLADVRARLTRYAGDHGPLFEPAPLIERLAAEGRGFYTPAGAS